MEFPAKKESLSEMLNYIVGDLRKEGRDPAHLHKIELACEEALVNIIYYAYPNNGSKIVIERERNQRQLIITLRDHGTAFNPLEAKIDPQIDIPLQERKIGGLGIFLIRQFTNEVSYRREGAENILQLTFYLDLV
jgi:serine/threonine-protein kinase RsbW